MNTKQIIICLVLSLLAFSKQAYSVSACPVPLVYTQPDGAEITIRLHGDERVSWAETTDGYTLLRNRADGWEYARRNRYGDLENSGVLAHDLQHRDKTEETFTGQIQKQLNFSEKQLVDLTRQSELQLKSAQNTNGFAPVGSKKLLMILIGFSDKPFVQTNESFNNLMNKRGLTTSGITGSVNDYFRETSYGQFDLTTTVVGPYTATNTLDYYGTNSPSKDYRINELIVEALSKANADVNYADFDNDLDGVVDGVYVVYAGYGEASGAPSNTIWPKAGGISTQIMDGKYIKNYSCSSELRGTTGDNITTIGVICHEFGHTCGARDYYDIDDVTGGSFTGTGNWDLMAGGNWNGSPSGSCPAHFNPKVKVDFNWVTPVVLSSAATVSIPDVTTSKSIYIYNTNTSNEYFILENRQKNGFNASIPGHGLMIYHYSKSYFDNNSYRNKTHPQGFYPVCASATSNPGSSPANYGTINSDGCPFPGRSKKVAFSDFTTPCSKSWDGSNTGSELTNISEISGNIYFCFKGCSSPLPPTEFDADAKSATEIELKWKNNEAGNNVVVAYSVNPVFDEPVEGKEYKDGDALNGGATVLYCGNGSSFIHKGLKSNVVYYYKIWSVDTRNHYSPDLPSIAGTPFSHIWSGAVSSDWFNAGNWLCNSIPVAESNVMVPSGGVNQPTINAQGAICNDLLLETGASLTMDPATAYSFTVNGNFTNNGSFVPGIGSVEFVGNNLLQTVGGKSATPFYLVKIDKGSPDKIVEVVSPISLLATTNPLILKSGTFKLSSGSVLTPFTSSGGATITNGSGLWINGGTINSGNFNWTVNGAGKGALLKITGGTLNIGTNSGNSLIYLNNPSIIVEDGNLNIAARIQPNSSTSSGSYMQTGGVVTVLKAGSASTTQAAVDFTVNMQFVMSGGYLVIQKGSSNSTTDISILSASINITGGTLQLGNEQTPESQLFRINSQVPVYNLEINSPNATVKLVNNSITVLNDLSVRAGKLDIEPGKQLLVYNSVVNHTDSPEGIKLSCDATGSGTLICSKAKGLATAETYFTKGAWKFYAPPLSGQSISDFLTVNGGIIPEDVSKKYMREFVPLSNGWKDIFAKEAQGVMEKAKGYEICSSAASKIVNSGSINAGQVTVAVEPGKWNLIGNPYCSGLGINGKSKAADNFLNINSEQIDSSYQAVYFWEMTDSYPFSLNKNYILSNAGSTVNNVPVGQAFFIKAAANAHSVVMTPEMQVQTNYTELKSEEYLWPQIELVALNNQFSTSAKILFSNDMTTGLDPGYDVGIFKDAGANSIYTRLVNDNGKDFAIQFLPITGMDNLVIPVGMDCPKGGEVEFSAKLNSLLYGINLYIEDMQNKTIKQIGGGDSYKTTVDAGSTGFGRFYLKFQPYLTNVPISPASNEIKVFADNREIAVSGLGKSDVKLSLYDVTGKLVVIKELTGNNSEKFSVQGLKTGIYYLVVSGKKDIKSFKIRIF